METFKRENIGKAETGGTSIIYKDLEEQGILDALVQKSDFDSLRLKRLLAMPDLTRKANSPLKFILDAIITLQSFSDFDVVEIPETITVADNFDRFDFPKDHPARRPSDTYFVSNDRVLRTHTTSMWLYYLD